MFKIGEVLPMPVVEFYLKSEELHDPILMKDSCACPEACYQRGEEAMKSLMLRVNSLLKRFFELDGFILVDFKLEFGHDENNYLLVGDELNHDSMRIWEVETLRCFDKNIYRTGSTFEKVIETYQLLGGSRNGLKVDLLK